MVRVALATLGCKVNQCESAVIMETLQESGFSPVPFTEPADVYIINTCTVTKKSDYQSRQLIGRAVQQNSEATILVTGCYAQMFSEEIACIPGVTVVAGNVEKGNILHLIQEAVPGEKKIMLSDIRQVSEFSTPASGAIPGRTRAFLKIQDGCDTFCSYCIVPYARGKSRSLPKHDVIDRVTALAKAGYRELVLTGINLGAYGRDFNPAMDLHSLLLSVAKNTPIPRLRLSSLEPRQITPALLSLVKEQEVFCRHFHIPFQSGDDKILALMKRNYDAAFFRNCVENILQYLPDVAIGIDIMVGFPGEGEAEFSHTRQLIEELPIAYLHVFPIHPVRARRPPCSLTRWQSLIKKDVPGS